MKIVILCLKKILQNHLIYSWANNGEFNVKEGTARERDEIIKKHLVLSSDSDRSIYVYLYRYTILFFLKIEFNYCYSIVGKWQKGDDY